MRNTPVVVLGLYDTGLFIAQSIAKYKIPIYGFDYNINNPGFFSRHITPKLAPHPYFSPEELLDFLVIKCDDFSSKPVLIPASEEYLWFISKYRDLLKQSYQFIIPEEKIVQKILNKSSQFELAKNTGLNVPDYYKIYSQKDFHEFLNQYNTGLVIIKALEQVEWKSKAIKKAFIAKNYEDLKNIAHKLFESETSFIIQNIVQGNCTNNYEFNALMVGGNIVESCVINKLRQYPPGFGAASCIQISDNDIVNELGKKFIIQNRVEGFSNTEFKYNLVDETYYFIESNARAWQQIRLTESLGQNFVLSYYNHFIKETVKSNVPRKVKSVKWIDIFSDFVLWWRYLRNSKFGFFKYILSMKNVKNFGLLNLSDLRPFLHEIKNILSRN